MDEWNCQHCGKLCTRPKVRGQRPKWCSPECCNKAKYVVELAKYKDDPRDCARCGSTFAPCTWSQTYCSIACGNANRHRGPSQTRSPLRKAIDEHDYPALVGALRERSTPVGSCWEWTGPTKGGYPIFSPPKGKSRALHRAIIETREGRELGSQHGHHMCGNRLCVNPEHLQAVTNRENVAEMLARQSYIARISELEQALADIDPNHPLLAHIPVRA